MLYIDGNHTRSHVRDPEIGLSARWGNQCHMGRPFHRNVPHGGLGSGLGLGLGFRLRLGFRLGLMLRFRLWSSLKDGLGFGLGLGSSLKDGRVHAKVSHQLLADGSDTLAGCLSGAAVAMSGMFGLHSRLPQGSG